MLPRWNSVIYGINILVQTLDKLLPRFRRNKRGRKPKHSIRDYVKLVIAKEAKKSSLREAEADYSQSVCNNRVDHSVIHYWEKKLNAILPSIVALIGNALDKQLKYMFSVIDSTKFSFWLRNDKETEFHVMNRISRHTVYPVSIFHKSCSPSAAVSNVVTEGRKNLLADAWYDDNKSMGIMFERGYKPLVCPNKNRSKGYWRRKARKLYNTIVGRMAYRQRGRGESLFGSLTNAFGDRLHTRRWDTSRTRISARVIAYQVKIYIRTLFLLGIVRHALFVG